MALLHLANIVKNYGTTKAVDQVSLTIAPQRIFGLLGPNGAGKTTLIRMITNILVPDSGEVRLDGEIVTSFQTRFIGYMPEERGLYRKMKVGEHLLYLAQLKNLPYKVAKEKINHWMHRFDIQDWWDKRIQELSKGMQQKIQFIATIVHEPKLLILDEPFSGLDPINTNLMKEEIIRLKKNGTTILFSTHRMEQVEQLCEEIALIHQGKKILDGEVMTLKQRFKKNEFVIDYLGTLMPMEDRDFDIISQTDTQFYVKMPATYTSNQLLTYLIDKGVKIQSFNEILPSLNEIFVRQIQEN